MKVGIELIFTFSSGHVEDISSMVQSMCLRTHSQFESLILKSDLLLVETVVI
jgi:hypothetical protein